MHVIIAGAGPAGLTAAVELTRRGVPVTVFEQDRHVGGIARTEDYKGYRFDIGGHRFFTKIERVNRFWHELLADEFLTRPRISRIYYRGRFFDYPLKAFNALSNLGPWTAARILASYLASQLFPTPREDTFEEWVCNRFGKVLYQIFFKTYTEKVWGIPCSEIRAEWAAQRIKGLSLPVAIRNALLPPRGEVVKTLIEEFEYPRLGPGQMWQAATRRVQEAGGEVHLQTPVVRFNRDGSRVRSVTVHPVGSVQREVSGTDFLATLPLTELVQAFDPPAPEAVRQAVSQLRYRDFVTVVLILDQPHLFPDNWIYIHAPEVQVGRIQNFKNWSPEMVPDPSKTSLGLEYFCTEGDEMWNLQDADFIALGRRELATIGLARAEQVIDGTVVRQRKAYPVYDSAYAEALVLVKEWLATLENFQTVGRNGLHKYNNQDHSMLTAMLAVENLFGARHDLWEVNTERSYHEEVRLPHSALSIEEVTA